MIEASLLLLGLVLFKAFLEEFWGCVQDRYARHRVEKRKIMMKLDGPLLLLLVFSGGCSWNSLAPGADRKMVL